eukprot:GHVL01005872.1.p1 GENE.GHVL01005872.1~~GHVL01005872.1.p1  ORF type:complete len:767 (-),score=217.10 GHVL01005872.1:1183-3204(-)
MVDFSCIICPHACANYATKCQVQFDSNNNESGDGGIDPLCVWDDSASIISKSILNIINEEIFCILSNINRIADWSPKEHAMFWKSTFKNVTQKMSGGAIPIPLPIVKTFSCTDCCHGFQTVINLTKELRKQLYQVWMSGHDDKISRKVWVTTRRLESACCSLKIPKKSLIKKGPLAPITSLEIFNNIRQLLKGHMAKPVTKDEIKEKTEAISVADSDEEEGYIDLADGLICSHGALAVGIDKKSKLPPRMSVSTEYITLALKTVERLRRVFHDVLYLPFPLAIGYRVTATIIRSASTCFDPSFFLDTKSTDCTKCSIFKDIAVKKKETVTERLKDILAASKCFLENKLPVMKWESSNRSCPWVLCPGEYKVVKTTWVQSLNSYLKSDPPAGCLEEWEKENRPKEIDGDFYCGCEENMIMFDILDGFFDKSKRISTGIAKTNSVHTHINNIYWGTIYSQNHEYYRLLPINLYNILYNEFGCINNMLSIEIIWNNKELYLKYLNNINICNICKNKNIKTATIKRNKISCGRIKLAIRLCSSNPENDVRASRSGSRKNEEEMMIEQPLAADQVQVCDLQEIVFAMTGVPTSQQLLWIEIDSYSQKIRITNKNQSLSQLGVGPNSTPTLFVWPSECESSKYIEQSSNTSGSGSSGSVSDIIAVEQESAFKNSALLTR